MQTRVNVTLGGVSLASVDDAIIVQGVDENAVDIATTGAQIGHFGQRLTAVDSRQKEISVRFAVNVKRDLSDRAAILDKIAGWAAAARNVTGAWLTVSYRTGQRMRVVATGYPAIQGIDRWAETYKVTFRAFALPCWEAVTANSGTATTASGSVPLTVSGNIPTPIQVTAVNSSGGVVNTLSFSANGRAMSFAGLGLANNETFILDYDERNTQRILIYNGTAYRSAMAARSTASHDEVLAVPGANAISVSAGASLAWTVKTFGRWAG